MPDSIPQNLLQWYSKNKRDLPWRQTDDPYKIWISEIMLQQTRVDTVIPYYNKFVTTFPTIKDLAEASQQQVLKLWEGLGYYSRGRNLHHTAKTVVDKFGGRFPSSYDDITSLKGIGPYTAAALLSIIFDKPYAVVDGNVLRVLARIYGIKNDIRSGETKREIQAIADDLLPTKNPGDFNQAVMELGATVCKPRNPGCNYCPVSVDCMAYNRVETDVIPYKSAAKKIPHHQIAVGLIVNKKNELLIALRPDDVMLGGLWEFAGGKKKKNETVRETVKRELREELGVEVEVFEKFHQLKHAYSHFKITLHAFWCRITDGTPEPRSSSELRWVSLDEIDRYPFPKANKTLIEHLRNIESGEFVKFVS